MVVWSDTEIAVFYVVALMVIFKLGAVWYVSLKSNANSAGRMIFLGIISGLTVFGVVAKFYISSVMGM